MHLKHLFTVDLNRFSVFGGKKVPHDIFCHSKNNLMSTSLYCLKRQFFHLSSCFVNNENLPNIDIEWFRTRFNKPFKSWGGEKIKLSMFYIFHSSVNTAQPEMNCICKSELSVKPETLAFAAFCNDGPILCSKKYTTLSSSFHH